MSKIWRDRTIAILTRVIQCNDLCTKSDLSVFRIDRMQRASQVLLVVNNTCLPVQFPNPAHTHTHTYELPEHLLLSGAAMGMPWALTPLLRKSEKSVSVGL